MIQNRRHRSHYIYVWHHITGPLIVTSKPRCKLHYSLLCHQGDAWASCKPVAVSLRAALRSQCRAHAAPDSILIIAGSVTSLFTDGSSGYNYCPCVLARRAYGRRQSVESWSNYYFFLNFIWWWMFSFFLSVSFVLSLFHCREREFVPLAFHWARIPVSFAAKVDFCVCGGWVLSICLRRWCLMENSGGQSGGVPRIDISSLMAGYYVRSWRSLHLLAFWIADSMDKIVVWRRYI